MCPVLVPKAVAHICDSSSHAVGDDRDGRTFARVQSYFGIDRFDGSNGSDHHQDPGLHKKRRLMMKTMEVESAGQYLNMSIGAWDDAGSLHGDARTWLSRMFCRTYTANCLLRQTKALTRMQKVKVVAVTESPRPEKHRCCGRSLSSCPSLMFDVGFDHVRLRHRQGHYHAT